MNQEDNIPDKTFWIYNTTNKTLTFRELIIDNIDDIKDIYERYEGKSFFCIDLSEYYKRHWFSIRPKAVVFYRIIGDGDTELSGTLQTFISACGSHKFIIKDTPKRFLFGERDEWETHEI